MNDVASKVADLASPDSVTYALGLDFSPDGARLAVNSFGEQIRSESIPHSRVHVWDWQRSRIERSLVSPAGFGTETSTNPIAYSPNGDLLAVCDGAGEGNIKVRIWNTSTWSIAKDLVEPGLGLCAGVSFTLNGKQLLRLNSVGIPDTNIAFAYEVGTWKVLWGLRIKGFTPLAIAISPDGERVAIGGRTTVVPWEIADPVMRLQHTKNYSEVNIVDLRDQSIQKNVRIENQGPLAWSTDAERIAIAGGNGLEIIDARSGELLTHENISQPGHMNVRFSADGHYLVESDFNGRGTGHGVKIWDSRHQHLLQEIPGNIGGIAISKDSKYLAVGEPGRTTIWRFK